MNRGIGLGVLAVLLIFIGFLMMMIGKHNTVKQFLEALR
jgi:Na+/phosphate symporter